MTRHLKLFLLALLFVGFGSSLSAHASTFDLVVPIEGYCLAPPTTAEYLDAFTGVWADPTVSFKTVTGPKWGDCGQFEWKVKWFLQPAPLAAEAWIVQHVVGTYDVVDCKGNKVNIPNYDIYEAWRMGKNGEAMPKYTYDF